MPTVTLQGRRWLRLFEARADPGCAVGSAASFTAGYRPAMAVSAGISLLGAAAAVAIGRKRPAPAAGPAPASLPVPAAKWRGPAMCPLP